MATLKSQPITTPGLSSHSAEPNPFANKDNLNVNRNSIAESRSSSRDTVTASAEQSSPVDSNGTEQTDIEDERSSELAKSRQGSLAISPDTEIKSPKSAASDKLSRLDMQKASPSVPQTYEDAPQSVIHAPPGFGGFENDKAEEDAERTSGAKSPATPEAAISPLPRTPSFTSPLNTDIPMVTDRSTPRAQTRKELDDQARRKKRTTMLDSIPESGNTKPETDEETFAEEETPQKVTDNVVEQTIEKDRRKSTVAGDDGVALQAALSECWTLCNTLANLSSTHRMRSFQHADKHQHTERTETAWRSCWRLCQDLYNSRDDDHSALIIPTLELCRDFCSSLFEVRLRGDEASDSVLRVSFELNNHLYNTYDRSLPDAFSERTLDFYITLCHRLMKQRTSLPEEADALLRACWNLAEMLFNLRQHRQEGKNPDEEQLGSAVQACWDLCDLFREGWSQIRPDRGTPRAQNTFSSHGSTPSIHSGTARSTSSLSDRQYSIPPSGPVPETPTTIFDDTTVASSPDSESQMPNILVLGTSSGNSRTGPSHHERWSSNASVLSDYSESASSQRTSSTATAGTDETHLNRLRYLLIKAAMDNGWTRSSSQHLPSYAQQMSKTAFGAQQWQVKIFNYYQKLVTNDKSMVNAHAFPARRISVAEMAQSVKWLSRKDQWAWVRDLYRVVYGFGIEEADRRNAIIII